jgi:hypothetical protein
MATEKALSVPVRITQFSIRSSNTPNKPLTIAFTNEANKDHPREGIEMDVTVQEANDIALQIVRAVTKWATR